MHPLKGIRDLSVISPHWRSGLAAGVATRLNTSVLEVGVAARLEEHGRECELLFQNRIVAVADKLCLGRFGVLQVAERTHLDMEELVGR